MSNQLNRFSAQRFKALSVHGMSVSADAYDPALDVIKHELEKGRIDRAVSRAYEVASPNPGCGLCRL